MFVDRLSLLASCFWLQILALGFCEVAVVDGFGVQIPTNSVRQRYTSTEISLVTEDDVLEAVEKAESLWAKALDARKTANALSDRAEEEAEAAASVSKDVEEMVNNRTAISMEQLAQADAAASANLDATIFVNKALAASDEADRLEVDAEESLKIMQERLDQHLIDFPDSPLAEE